MLLGLAEGCDSLLGLEDNIFLEKGVLATSAQLVERACKLGMARRTIAAAAAAGRILNDTFKDSNLPARTQAVFSILL